MTRFLSLLSLLMVAGNAFVSVTADESVSDKELDTGYYECKRGECQWNCPKDWCWVAYRGHLPGLSNNGIGVLGWKWLECKTAKDCERGAAQKTCKHITGGPYDIANCPFR